MKIFHKSLIFFMSTLAILLFSACDDPPDKQKKELSSKEKYLNKKLQEERDNLKQTLDKKSSDMMLTVVTFKENGEARELTNEEDGFFAKISPMLCDGGKIQNDLKNELFKMGFGDIELLGTMHNESGNVKTIDLITLNSENISLTCETKIGPGSFQINHSRSVERN